MIKVASSEGVSIYCPRNGKFSLFNSPYPAHKSHAAVDIYPGVGFGSISPSPVSGEVKRIMKVFCPEKTNFKSTDYDYVVLLQSLENPNVWIKILHIEPLVRVGDVINVGDDLGVLLRSGFFDYWTDPHVHVEIRDPADPIRARGGLKIRGENFYGKPSTEIEELHGTVVEIKEEYFLVALSKELKYGVPVSVNGEPGFIDGGIPHYGYFGVHMSDGAPSCGTIELCGTKIGIIESIYQNTCVAKCLCSSFKVGRTPVKLSLYMHPSRLLIKVIPEKGYNLSLKGLEEISIAILGR